MQARQVPLTHFKTMHRPTVMVILSRSIFILLSLLCHVSSYETGSPTYTCFTQYPMHGGAHTQPPSSSPYRYTFSPPSYTPGGQVTVTVKDVRDNLKMEGIQTSVRRTTGNTDEIVGQLKVDSGQKLKVFNCFNGSDNMLTHREELEVEEITFTWVAPPSSVGDVEFRSTVLRSFSVFWYDLKHILPVSDQTLPVESSPYPPLPLNTIAWNADVDPGVCGITRGCFTYPRHCSGNGCTVLATFLYDNSTNIYNFELLTTLDVGYVSLAFSKDIWMGDEFTVSCTANSGQLSVQEGWNQGRSNDRHLDIYTASRQVAYKDGKLQCRFSLPEKLGIYSVSQGPDAEISTKQLELSDRFCLMMAWGKVTEDSSVLAHHCDLPAVSSCDANLRSTEIYMDSPSHKMVKAHAAVMIVAWVLLTGALTVISRHYKDWMPNTTLLGTKLWFQIHRGLAILVAVFTAIGLILIFAHFGPAIRRYAGYHAYVGLALTGCMGLQLIGGVLRPNGDSKRRPIFNWVHRILGHVSHILAAATMFLAFEIQYILPDMRRVGIIALSAWVVTQVVWHLIFEWLCQRHHLTGRTDHYDLDRQGDAKVDDSSKQDKSGRNSILFIVYAVCLTGLSLVVLLAFLLD